MSTDRPDHSRQFVLQFGHAEQTRLLAGIEFHDQVDVTLRAGAASQLRTKERKTANMVLPAKRRN